MDSTVLAELLREAEEHHGPYEAVAPKHHWSDWYAEYITARRAGQSMDDADASAGQALQKILQRAASNRGSQ